MKINIEKIREGMKLKNLSNIRLLPDDFKPKEKHLYCSIALTVMGTVIAVLCIILSVMDETKIYLKGAVILLSIFIAIFILMTIEIQKRLKNSIIG